MLLVSVNQTPDSVKVLIEYSLKNGKSISDIYEVKLIEGKWQVNKKYHPTAVLTS